MYMAVNNFLIQWRIHTDMCGFNRLQAIKLRDGTIIRVFSHAGKGNRSAQISIQS